MVFQTHPEERKRIVVLGGAVMDLHFRVPGLPRWKEAVQADSFALLPGGKGLNQAGAAARLGAAAHLISAVGNDYFGEQLISTLRKEDVDATHVSRMSEPTAVTAVLLSYQADPAFIGWKSVTARVGPQQVERAADLIREADALLITLEVSLAAVRKAVEIAMAVRGRERGRPYIVLNPAPPLSAPENLDVLLLSHIDALVPNQWEARQILGKSAARMTRQQLAAALRDLGVRIACVTTSEAGCVVAQNGEVAEYPSAASKPVDTTGASDAFCAALGLALANGLKPIEAFRHANAAGLIAVSRIGGLESMPRAHELRDVLEKGRFPRPRTAQLRG